CQFGCWLRGPAKGKPAGRNQTKRDSKSANPDDALSPPKRTRFCCVYRLGRCCAVNLRNRRHELVSAASYGRNVTVILRVIAQDLANGEDALAEIRLFHDGARPNPRQ